MSAGHSSCGDHVAQIQAFLPECLNDCFQRLGNEPGTDGNEQCLVSCDLAQDVHAFSVVGWRSFGSECLILAVSRVSFNLPLGFLDCRVACVGRFQLLTFACAGAY